MDIANRISLPGFSSELQQRRFFIALLPPLAIQDYATSVIRELSECFQTRTAKAPPHVTLQAPFLWPLETVASLQQSLRQVASQHRAFPVTLSGFAAFPPRVLYLNVLKTPELLTLQTRLSEELEQIGIVDAVAKRRPFTPHLTVASRNLTRQTFRAAWSRLESRVVNLEFTAEHLTLLLHDGQGWQVHSEFALLPAVPRN